MDLDRRLELLTRENDELRERVDALERALVSIGVLFPIEWRLTASESVVLGVLMARELATKDAILTAFYQGRDEAEIKIVDVFVCKLRKKLAPFGVNILTRWGAGYFLDVDTKAFVRASA